jgi:hypothetical protein
MTLYFPWSQHQSLQHIVVPSVPNVTQELSYESQPLSSRKQPLTRARVGRVLGPTFVAATGDKLVYPGITFDFSTTTGTNGGGREDIVESIRVSPRNNGLAVGNESMVECEVQVSSRVTRLIL